MTKTTDDFPEFNKRMNDLIDEQEKRDKYNEKAASRRVFLAGMGIAALAAMSGIGAWQYHKYKESQKTVYERKKARIESVIEDKLAIPGYSVNAHNAYLIPQDPSNRIPLVGIEWKKDKLVASLFVYDDRHAYSISTDDKDNFYIEFTPGTDSIERVSCRFNGNYIENLARWENGEFGKVKDARKFGDAVLKADKVMSDLGRPTDLAGKVRKIIEANK